MQDGLRFLGLDDISITQNPILDKQRSVRHYVGYMFNRTSRMFEWSGLPPTIPSQMLEQYLQYHGFAGICIPQKAPKIVHGIDIPPASSQTNQEPILYAFFGGLGGEPDAYYRPTKFTVSNPHLNFSETYTIGERCVIIKNDTRFIGLLPLFIRYASQLAENDISIRSSQINSRQHSVISAQTETEIDSARQFIKKQEEGEIGIIAEAPFIEGIKVQNGGVQSANNIIQLIELQQYIKASWFNEVGLNTAFNMKREYLSAQEVASNTDILLPLVDDMFECRKACCQIVNETFGTNWSVKKSSAWENKAQVSDADIQKAQAEADISSTNLDTAELGGVNHG